MENWTTCKTCALFSVLHFNFEKLSKQGLGTRRAMAFFQHPRKTVTQLTCTTTYFSAGILEEWSSF
jgi:hypothetical protein